MSTYKRLLFIINPNAGMRRKESPLSELIMTFSDYDYETIVCFTKKQGDATLIVEEHANHEIDLIICMGGDGTLNETFAGANNINWNRPIGYIPAGSTNDFASSLGLPSDPIEVAKLIMEGKPRLMDIGEFNGRKFVYTAACGIFTKISYETPQKVKNRLGHFAYLLEGVKDFTQLHSIHMKISTDSGELYEDDYLMVALCNTFSLGGVMSLDEGNVEFDDGLFELLMISMPRDIMQLNSIVMALYEQSYTENSGLVRIVKVKSAEIDFPASEDWSLDGERGEGQIHNTFKVIPSAINLIY